MSDMLTETPAPNEAAWAKAATAAIPVHAQDGEPEFHIRPITVAEYNAMGEAGILDPDERVELVDGLLIVPPPPQGAPHVSIILRLYHHFNARFGKRVLITSQMPVIVSERLRSRSPTSRWWVGATTSTFPPFRRTRMPLRSSKSQTRASAWTEAGSA